MTSRPGTNLLEDWANRATLRSWVWWSLPSRPAASVPAGRPATICSTRMPRPGQGALPGKTVEARVVQAVRVAQAATPARAALLAQGGARGQVARGGSPARGATRDQVAQGGSQAQGAAPAQGALRVSPVQGAAPAQGALRVSPVQGAAPARGAQRVSLVQAAAPARAARWVRSTAPNNVTESAMGAPLRQRVRPAAKPSVSPCSRKSSPLPSIRIWISAWMDAVETRIASISAAARTSRPARQSSSIGPACAVTTTRAARRNAPTPAPMDRWTRTARTASALRHAQRSCTTTITLRPQPTIHSAAPTAARTPVAWGTAAINIPSRAPRGQKPSIACVTDARPRGPIYVNVASHVHNATMR